jgi:hypothetical protein
METHSVLVLHSWHLKYTEPNVVHDFWVCITSNFQITKFKAVFKKKNIIKDYFLNEFLMYHVSSFSGQPVFAANRFSLKIKKMALLGI